MEQMNSEDVEELRRDNNRLRRLLDQQNAPGELRHRLRRTLAMLRVIIRKSSETGRELADYIAHLEDRLDAITHAQSLADEHAEVDLRTLLADELFRYGASEGEQLVMSGPDVVFQPKAGQVIALAFHELAVNAVEHGCLGEQGGSIDVAWHMAPAQPDALLVLAWTERGASSAVTPARNGFGTEVLTRLLSYELKAEASLDSAPDRLRWTMRVPLPIDVGRLVD